MTKRENLVRLLSWSLGLAATATLAAACSGPPIPSHITGEPICTDFAVGATGTSMRGGLKYPVRLSVLDGKSRIARVMLFGKRNEADPGTRIVLPDANVEYTVEWAQCENTRASVPVTGGKTASKDGAAYECGEAAVYKTETLKLRKGDPGSHAITFVAPPKADCWIDERPAEEKTAAADAGADAEAADAAVAEDAGSDAAVEVADAGAADAAVTDAGAAKDAGKDEKKDATKGEKKP